VGLLFGHKAALEKARQLRSATARKVAELQQLCREIGSELGGGHFSELAELRGTIGCASPLTAELSKTPCVYYRSSVAQEYEETRTETDSQSGQQRQVMHRGSETVSSNRRTVPFTLADETGAIEVLADGADIDEEQSLSRFEPESAMAQPGSATIGFGLFSMTLSAGLPQARRVLGYRLNEWLLPVGRQAFIIGEVTDSEGRLVVRKPSKEGARFIISARSKEAVLQATGSKAKIFLFAAIACFVLGAGLLVKGLVA
jgi:hypothetical protein